MMCDFNECFRAALSYILEKKGYGAQTIYAEKAGISQQMISAIARGRSSGTIGIKRKIAKATGYKYEDFLELGHSLLPPENQLPENLPIPQTPPIDAPDTEHLYKFMIDNGWYPEELLKHAKRIKAAIKAIPKYHKPSQTSIARRVGIAQSFLSALINGKKRPSWSTTKLLVKAVPGTTPDLWRDGTPSEIKAALNSAFSRCKSMGKVSVSLTDGQV